MKELIFKRATSDERKVYEESWNDYQYEPKYRENFSKITNNSLVDFTILRKQREAILEVLYSMKRLGLEQNVIDNAKKILTKLVEFSIYFLDLHLCCDEM